MARPYQQLAKNIKFLPCIFVLLFALLGLSTATPNTHAAATLSTPNLVTSDNWSGDEAQGKLGSFNRAQIAFTIPSLKSNGDMSIWVGLGGDPTLLGGNPNNAVLVQAGVDSCLGSSCFGPCPNPNRQCNYAWWEIADALVVQPIRFSKPISAGNLITVYLESNFNNKGSDRLTLTDLTTGESHTILVGKQSATKDGQRISIITPNGRSSSLNGIKIVSDGASAECIGERPLVGSLSGGSFTTLPSFLPVNISRCDVGNNRLLEAISRAQPVNQITMVDRGSSGRRSLGNSVRGANANADVPRMVPGPLHGRYGDAFILAEPTAQQPLNSTARFVKFPSRASQPPPGS